MNSETLGIIIPSVCTLIGTFSGIIVSSKLTNYRIGQLEKKVDKHNCLVERMYKCEERISLLERDEKNEKMVGKIIRA